MVWRGAPLLRATLILALALTGPAGGLGAAPPSGTQTAYVLETTIEGVSAYRWPNGLRALLIPDPTIETITVSTTYFAGSRNESYGQTGIAHLLEHLMFDRTRSHPDVPKELTAHGGQSNAETGADSTMYYETVPARAADLQWALQLEADRMANAVISDDRLAPEVAVIRNELAMDENIPATALTERLFAAAYTWHNYGKGVGGALSDLQTVNAAQVRSFYRTYYRPDNAVVVVAGKLDVPSTLAAIGNSFGAIPRPDYPLPKALTVEPPQEGPRSVQLMRAGDVQLLQVGYHIPSATHPDFAPIQILAGLLGRSPDGPLHQALVGPGKAVSAYGYATFMRDPGLTIFGARMPPAAPSAPTLDVMLRVLERHGAHVSDVDVAHERRRAINAMDDILRSTQDFALEIGDWAAMGDWRLFFLHRERLEGVSAADVERVARHYLTAANRTVAHYLPGPDGGRVAVPAAPDTATLLNNSIRHRSVSSGESFDSSPANVESHLIRASLSSGLKVALLPKRTRGGRVNLVLNLRFGDSSSLNHQRWTGYLTAGMLLRGTLEHTRKQLQNEFVEAGAEVSLSGGAQSVTCTIATTRENLVHVLRLVREALRRPAFPVAEFEQLKRSTLLSTASERSDPDSLAWNTINRALHPYPPGDIRRVQTPDEKLDALNRVTLADVRQFHSKFYGASHGELSVVGDFEPGGLLEVAEECFGNWKNPRPFHPIVRVYRKAPAVKERLNEPDRQNGAFTAGLLIPVGRNSPDYPALLLATYLMGGDFLNSRLPARIRRRDGLSYSVESQLYGGTLDPALTFLTTALCEPRNFARLEAAFHDEIERSLRNGFGEAEVDAAKNGWLREQEVAASDDRQLAWDLTTDLFTGRTRMWHADLRRRIELLTAEEITAVWRKHMQPANLSLVEAGDFGHSNELAVSDGR